MWQQVDLILEVLSKLTQAQLSMAKNEQKKCPLRCGNVAQIAATALVSSSSIARGSGSVWQVEEALSRGSMDNVTVMIVLL